MEGFWLLLVWGLLAAGVGAYAGGKGRSAFGYFALSFVLSPLIGVIAAAIATDKTAEAAADEQRRRDHEQQLESIRAIARSSDPGRPAPHATPEAVSLADELRKLADLRRDGLLTDEEFQEQKAALLKRAT